MKSFTRIHCPKVITCWRGAAHAKAEINTTEQMISDLRSFNLHHIVIASLTLREILLQ